jgi:hypothetical protein
MLPLSGGIAPSINISRITNKVTRYSPDVQWSERQDARDLAGLASLNFVPHFGQVAARTFQDNNKRFSTHFKTEAMSDTLIAASLLRRAWYPELSGLDGRIRVVLLL